MMTEMQVDGKYPEGTPHWRKAAYERYVCSKHGRPTMFIRDSIVAVHTDMDDVDECH